MGFDFSFDPGTSAELQREVDKITGAYGDQERAVERTIQRTRQLDVEIKRVGQTMRTEFLAGGARRDFGNFKDVIDLMRGQISFRNLHGAVEMATDLAQSSGMNRLASLGGAALAAAPFIGVGIIGTKIIQEIGASIADVKEPAKAQHRLKTEAARLFKDMSVEDQRDIAARLDRAFMPPHDPNSDMNFFDQYADRVRRSGLAGATFARQAGLAMQNPELASAFFTELRMQQQGMYPGFNFKGGHQATRALQGELVGQSAQAVRSAFIAEAEFDPKSAIALGGYIEKEISAFQKRNAENEAYLKNHPVERAEHNRRMMLLGAYEKEQLLASQDWNRW